MASTNAPKLPGERRRNTPPVRGDWKATPGIGWQHGPFPAPPDGLMQATVTAWETWLGSWVAANWTPMDAPGLRQTIRLFDAVERGEGQRTGELRLWMDTYGLTPKGQQDRRWLPTKDEDAPKATKPRSAYAHLKVVKEPGA